MAQAPSTSVVMSKRSCSIRSVCGHCLLWWCVTARFLLSDVLQPCTSNLHYMLHYTLSRSPVHHAQREVYRFSSAWTEGCSGGHSDNRSFVSPSISMNEMLLAHNIRLYVASCRRELILEFELQMIGIFFTGCVESVFVNRCSSASSSDLEVQTWGAKQRQVVFVNTASAVV